jgi:hypothetical protein
MRLAKPLLWPQDRPTIGTGSDRAGNATVRARHADRRIGAPGWSRAGVVPSVHIIRSGGGFRYGMIDGLRVIAYVVFTVTGAIDFSPALPGPAGA